MKRLLSSLIFIFFLTILNAQVSSDYAVLVSASYTESPTTITLHWPLYATATEYSIYKKEKETTSWGTAIATLTGDATSFTDTDIIIDSVYEYKIKRTNDAGISGFGYIFSGIKIHAVDYRGKCLVVVDTTITSTMENELYRLMKDISGDGWSVKRLNVARDQTVEHVRELINTEANADAEIQCVFLFGRVPVIYSGNLFPDGHPDHQGAWPADAIYGDINGNYTDDFQDVTTATRPENWNIPGDGKYDQSILNSDVELEIGRVDLFNLPTFTDSEETLLKKYLDKDHNFRNGLIETNELGLIDDNFGAFGGEAFAANGWRNFAPMFGDENIFEMDYFTTMYNENYLWSNACGGGWYQGAGGVGSTFDFTVDTVQTIFTMLFGSYFGDWDVTDNFLRAPLAAGLTLTNCWAGRPNWQFHHMALGENIGYSTRLTQNNNATYLANIFPHWVHIALMGDPTLRMHIVRPVENVTCSIATGWENVIAIDYTASTDPNVIGYYVYRSDSEFGKYIRITDEIINYSPYADESPLNGLNYYMVRAVALKETPSGSYYNLSTGVTDSISIILTGTNDLHSLTFKLQPNPSNNYFILSSPVELTGEEIFISDITGKQIQKNICTSSETKIDVSKLDNGIYFVGIKGGVQKLIVVH
ncbi:MAG: T9SS type A sorting domain-containing protein [Chitinophagales bacterium]